jgi:chemotaxis-related protein WspB
MLVRHGPGGPDPKTLGLLAEGVTETRSIPESAFRPPGIAPPDAAYLGDVATEEGGMIELLNVDSMLPDGLRSMLFAPPRSGGHE